MADGFIRWYREAAATPVLAQQAQLFERHGIVLVHPTRGGAVVLDVEGNAVVMRPEELGHLLALRIASLTMNWWFSANVNVIDQYVYEPLGCEIQTLWLDGLTPQQEDAVEAAVMAAARELPVPTRAVIVDRSGAGDPEDWDSAVLYEGDGLPPFPDRVLARHPLAQRFTRSPVLGRQEAGGGLTLFSPARPS
ncbi:hypothetical protein [Streptomyces roseolilacinus]|uniref:hypothetical protein n=1 Tax=Streptomyces roseolilacinus TaxID=66904 RepID=UPI0037FEAA2D